MTNSQEEKKKNENDYVMNPEDRAGASGPWLEARLKEEGLRAHSQSGIFRALKNLQLLRALILSKESMGVQPLKDLFDFFSESYGADFLSKALHWGYESGLRPTHHQWKQLISANPNIATRGQSRTKRNKVWETVIGSIANTFCTRVDFSEPDIICTFGGKNIAVAAKMANISENLRKGFKQAKSAQISLNAFALRRLLSLIAG